MRGIGEIDWEKERQRIAKMTDLVKKKGALLQMHSDGDIRTLVPDLMGCGLDVLNLQDLANSIDWIKENLNGKICIDLELDRQNITCFLCRQMQKQVVFFFNK